ncbi:hypothetical protein AGABI1DRAFT_95674 [Agaricus bisporus var. burnettii JB137-S8]|uniref:Uncharacterized protein n=1 Tax=Agaricus bisporus var. burnettii (strain JB137-S8 / ATCC MYA-4627 / FGSC 10392) TaxID=597362 RepID=K5WUZ1_AGABU|nr:uncharacterized protein AGABI1DRAFT_95674 [Agaricus bisporus var. burnettii JB137-S8]EKM74387.1 hypothetical protein AGABI1DRAFT_95674 [Agaricus bisporus var. burnettii JB137-S8]
MPNSQKKKKCLWYYGVCDAILSDKVRKAEFTVARQNPIVIDNDDDNAKAETAHEGPSTPPRQRPYNRTWHTNVTSQIRASKNKGHGSSSRQNPIIIDDVPGDRDHPIVIE